MRREESTFRKLEKLLLDHPDAVVLSGDSAGLGVPMPRSLPLDRHQVLVCRSFIDYVVPEDMSRVVHAFFEVLEVGMATTPVRLSRAPEQQLVLHIGDLRASHGVIFGIVVPGPDGGSGLTVADAQITRPRYSTLHQDGLGRILDCDEAFTAMFDLSLSDVAGTPSLDWIHPDDHARAIEGWMLMVTTRRPHHMRYRRRRKDGQWVWLDTTLTNHLGHADGDYVLVEMIDISAEMAAQEALAAREELLDRLAEALPVGLFQVDVDQRVVYTNDRLHAILGVSVTEDLGRLLATVAPEHRSRTAQALESVLDDAADADVEVDLEFTDTGERRICLMSYRPLTDKDGAVTGAIVCVSDITDTARMQVELHDKATFDVLTRCYNRGSTMTALGRVLADQGVKRTAVIFADLDDFKPVNDRLGHAAGDDLLTRVAELLAGAVRSEDIVGRIGGDEFLIVCPDIAGSDQALQVARRIAEALHREICLPAGTVELRASLGVALAQADTTADTLVARADEAMYRSKRQGDGRPVLYAPTLALVHEDSSAKAVRRRVRRG